MDISIGERKIVAGKDIKTQLDCFVELCSTAPSTVAAAKPLCWSHRQ